MRDAARRSALGVLASCLVHVAIVLGVHSRGSARAPMPPTPLWLELQVERREPQAAPDVSSVSEEVQARTEESSASLPTRLSRTPRSRNDSAAPDEARVPPPVPPRAPNPTPARVSVDELGPNAQLGSTSAEAIPSPTPGDEHEASRAAAKLDLSPLAAARTLADSTNFPLRDAGPSRADAPPPSPTATANALAARVPGLHASRGPGRSVKGAVVDGFEDTLYNVLRPWKLLHKTMRGSQYRYTGAGFDAAILPDGRVRFRDKDGLTLTVMANKPLESGPSAQNPPPATVGFSLGDPAALIARLRGKDPFAAERRTFLERTKALREYLAGRKPESSEGVLEPSPEVEGPEPEPRLEPGLGAQ